MTDRKPRGDRRYPEVYEKAIPIAIAVIVIVIAVLLLVVMGIVLKVLPGSSAARPPW